MKIIIVLAIAVVMTMMLLLSCRRAPASNPTTILLCIVEPDTELDTFAKIDADVYRRHYSHVTQTSCTNAGQLLSILKQEQHNIVHLFLRIDNKGNVSGINIRTILEECRRNGAKAIILGNDHNPDVYIKWVNVEGVNLVMTIERKGNLFPSFSMVF